MYPLDQLLHVLRLVRIVLDTKTDCLELLSVSILRFIAQTFEIVAHFRKKLDTFQYNNTQQLAFLPTKGVTVGVVRQLLPLS